MLQTFTIIFDSGQIVGVDVDKPTSGGFIFRQVEVTGDDCECPSLGKTTDPVEFEDRYICATCGGDTDDPLI